MCAWNKWTPHLSGVGERQVPPLCHLRPELVSSSGETPLGSAIASSDHLYGPRRRAKGRGGIGEGQRTREEGQATEDEGAKERRTKEQPRTEKRPRTTGQRNKKEENARGTTRKRKAGRRAAKKKKETKKKGGKKDREGARAKPGTTLRRHVVYIGDERLERLQAFSTKSEVSTPGRL